LEQQGSIVEFDSTEPDCSREAQTKWRRRERPRLRELKMLSPRQRRVVIERDGRCVICGSLKELEVHHIEGVLTPDGLQRINHYDNLAALCRRCHRAVTFLELYHPILNVKAVIPFLRSRIGQDGGPREASRMDRGQEKKAGQS